MQTYGSTVQLTGVKLVRHEPIFDLYRPAGTPRLRMIAAGRFLDGWLAPRGAFTVWSKTRRDAAPRAALPPGTRRSPRSI